MFKMSNIHDYLALCESKARYCRFLDTKDWESWREMFVEDFELDVTEGTNLPVIRGRDAAIEQILSSIRHAKTVHQVHNPEISIDGDEATAIWAMNDRLDFGPERPSIIGYGHYHERWVRSDGIWKIRTLRLTRLILEIRKSPLG